MFVPAIVYGSEGLHDFDGNLSCDGLENGNAFL